MAHDTEIENDVQEQCTRISSLSVAEMETLTASCTEAKSRAYCPYSHFRVGAAFLTREGQVFAGANVENAAYPVGTCAERVALCAAVTSANYACSARLSGAQQAGGVSRVAGYFKALAVATDVDGEPGSPCGMCRQALREFCSLDMPILLHNRYGNFVATTVGELLPMSFGPEALFRGQDAAPCNGT